MISIHGQRDKSWLLRSRIQSSPIIVSPKAEKQCHQHTSWCLNPAAIQNGHKIEWGPARPKGYQYSKPNDDRETVRVCCEGPADFHSGDFPWDLPDTETAFLLHLGDKNPLTNTLHSNRTEHRWSLRVESKMR